MRTDTASGNTAHRAIGEVVLEVPAGELVLTRCSCGGLYDAACIIRHLRQKATS